MSGYQLSGDAPTMYSRFAGKIMGTWTDDLILSARCQDGDQVLDVACGPGTVANRVNLVSHKYCTVTGIDLNEGMLNIARRNPNVDWHQGSASQLPFENGRFDVVLCQQGLQYFDDRSAAMKQMARVLAPGGRMAINVWGALDRQPFHSACVAGVDQFLGNDAVSAFDRAFSLHRAAELRQLAVDAGLTNIQVRFAHRTMRYASPARLVDGFMNTTPVSVLYNGLSDDRKRAFVAFAVEQLARDIDDEGLAVPQENRFLTAVKTA